MTMVARAVAFLAGQFFSSFGESKLHSAERRFRTFPTHIALFLLNITFSFFLKALSLKINEFLRMQWGVTWFELSCERALMCQIVITNETGVLIFPPA